MFTDPVPPTNCFTSYPQFLVVTWKLWCSSSL